jgi:hypothetical protein
LSNAAALLTRLRKSSLAQSIILRFDKRCKSEIWPISEVWPNARRRRRLDFVPEFRPFLRPSNGRAADVDALQRFDRIAALVHDPAASGRFHESAWAGEIEKQEGSRAHQLIRLRREPGDSSDSCARRSAVRSPSGDPLCVSEFEFRRNASHFE